MQLWQPPLPPKYRTMTEAELAEAILARKAQLGTDLVILGHHYQQDEVIRFADFTGDSFKLSQLAAEQVRKARAKYVIFCGVHFMAETADILTDDEVTVLLPDLSAGCSMADMADLEQTEEAWDDIHEVLGDAGSKGRVIPICYMNSSAAIKAFCGRHGGAVCTSSNCEAIFDWALAGGETPLAEGEQVKVLFLPDQHLGRNTAAAAGFDPVTQMCTWDPKADLGGLDPREIVASSFILWKGHCSVHKLFRAEHVDEVRALWPDVTVITHPECTYEVCQKADMTGSTEGIIKAIETAEPGSRWAIGTEVHLVARLAEQAKRRGVTVRILSDCQCLCTTMFRIDMPHLLHALDALCEDPPRVVNPIRVEAETAEFATLALDRMLTITGKATGSRDADAPHTTAAAAG